MQIISFSDSSDWFILRPRRILVNELFETGDSLLKGDKSVRSDDNRLIASPIDVDENYFLLEADFV